MPKTVAWYRTYCMVVALLYLLMVIGGGTLVGLVGAGQVNGAEEGNFMAAGAALLGKGCCFGVLYAFLPYALPRRPWAWVVHMIAIVLTMTDCCCIPFAIVLLIGWFKAETRAYFDMTPSS